MKKMGFITLPCNPYPPSTEQMGNGGGGSYTLPIASAETLGGVKVGSGLSINSETGTLSADSVPIASAETLGGVKVGSGLSIDSSTGVLSASGGGGIDLYPSTPTKVGEIAGVGVIYRKFSETTESLPDGTYTTSADLGTGIMSNRVRVVGLKVWGRNTSNNSVRLLPDKEVICTTTISGFGELMVKISIGQGVNLSAYKFCFIADYIIPASTAKKRTTKNEEV